MTPGSSKGDKWVVLILHVAASRDFKMKYRCPRGAEQRAAHETIEALSIPNNAGSANGLPPALLKRRLG
jgi:hypothetical protein